MEIYTIGFTQKSAAQFFGELRRAGVKRLLDVRLHNTSQLAGFAKREDLEFFLRELCGIAYEHEPLLTPTPAMLDAYRKLKTGWANYERDFLALLKERAVEKRLERARFATPTTLLCSEPAPERCHRRLAAEYLKQHWSDIQIIHL